MYTNMAKLLVVVAYLILCLAIVAMARSGRQIDDVHDETILRHVTFHSTVSQATEPGAYQSITAALKDAPTNSQLKYYIHVRSGNYFERVDVWQNKTNIVLIGDGASYTRVYWNKNVPDYGSALTVNGDGFIAMLIEFENTSGDNLQAAAATVAANRVAFYKCTFRGFHDTLYALSGTQFYRNCDIYGTVDFIFGGAAAVFQSCNLYADDDTTVTYTAQSKDVPSPTPPSGFVIQSSRLTTAPEVDPNSPDLKVYLGRPWKSYSTVVVMESYLDAVINPLGWYNGSGTDRLFYREYNNYGPGSNTERRVNWTGYSDVTGRPEDVESYTVGEFINKDGWLTATLIPHCDGFMRPVDLLVGPTDGFIDM